jgi:large subunit ribosomal protein L9
MATELMLMDTVPNLGTEGEIVTVANGYARNYLLPKGLGAPVTKAAQARLAKLQESRATERKQTVAAAKAAAKKLAGVSCTITVRTGEDDKLYGSVTNGDIAEALAEQGLEIDRHSIQLDGPIKELGVFDVAVRLDADVKATIKVWIVGE